MGADVSDDVRTVAVGQGGGASATADGAGDDLSVFGYEQQLHRRLN
ncbi:hypothetical protein [Streptomyces sp. NPDC051677]